MPKVGLTHSAPMETRNTYTKVDTQIAVSIDGKELPSMAVLGEALEAAVELFTKKIQESYKVPPRVETPIADVYATKPS